MAISIDSVLREQLRARHQKLEAAVATLEDKAELTRLLAEVDAALKRLERGSYGLCEVCHEPIESERLMADPLAQFCLDHLTSAQQGALKEALALASEIQRGLLPEQNFHFCGWEVAYHYESAGPVSGDYCDLVRTDEGDLYFIVGDVSGKGVAASMLMAHLHAMFRALIPVGLPLNQLVERASRVFCESTLPMHYATIVCGKAASSGEIEICNAGHLPPLLLSDDQVTCVEATGLPLGLFCNEQFSVTKLQLASANTLFLYTDGFSETRDVTGAEYGRERLSRLVSKSYALAPRSLISVCLEDLTDFRTGLPRIDDLTVMAIRRVG